MKLTYTRYNEFLTGIELQSLPSTFKDAITLTRYLGIDYLWIDSLCIIQDSQPDWQRESYRMSDVYQGSFLNIGANAYNNSNGGLFHERDPYTVTPLIRRLRWPPGRESWKTVAFFPIPPGGDRNKLRNAPLSSRGWVAQERLLAPRTLHFTARKVVWECPTMTATETDTTAILEGKQLTPQPDWVSLRSGLGPVEKADECLRKWDEAIRIYTQGDLTFQSDKLIAVSGLASRLRTLWNDESVRYLAGLWSHRLETSLLWVVSRGSQTLDTIADQRAPSWSWAAVRGQVFPGHFENWTGFAEYNQLADVLQAETYPIQHPLGPVNGGFIQIRGPLCVVTATQDQDGNHNVLQLNGTQITFRDLNPDGHSFVSSSETQSNELFLLGISIERGHEVFLRGLVLRPTGARSGNYTRVGCWTVGYQDMTIEANRAIAEFIGGAMDQDPCAIDFELILNSFSSTTLSEEFFEEIHRGPESLTYTIKIV
jgi:hypothetical protein